MNNRNSQSSFIRGVKKFFLSAFVVITFIAYALENRGAKAVSSVSLPAQAAAPTTSADNGATQSQTAQNPTGEIAAAQQAAPTQGSTASQPTTGSSATSNTPTQVPSTATLDTQTGQYKNGTYTGPQVDVNFGFVQVQAVIQNGKITTVQFLEFPQDRRTSQRINSFAVPILQQEAVQAQSANVNLITGATLTSEGFQQSLQAALNQANNLQ